MEVRYLVQLVNIMKHVLVFVGNGGRIPKRGEREQIPACETRTVYARETCWPRPDHVPGST